MRIPDETYCRLFVSALSFLFKVFSELIADILFFTTIAMASCLPVISLMLYLDYCNKLKTPELDWFACASIACAACAKTFAFV